MKQHCITKSIIAGISTVCLGGLAVLGSSHREAPEITKAPKIDGADFYIFNSYEEGREEFVTIIATYQPLQEGGAGPNYYMMDEDARYDIHIDNNGDAMEDLTFRFQFQNNSKDIALAIGPEGDTKSVAVPVINVGPIGAGNTAALNVIENYTLSLVQGNQAELVVNAANDESLFEKPVDFIGEKSIPNYDEYAGSYVYEIKIPGCETPGRLFVGQRNDPFVVNLGETFDLVNISTSPLGPEDANKDSLRNKNVTALVLEIPKSCLIGAAGNPVIGAWTTASVPQVTVSGGGVPIPSFTQVSRLGMPLVNEVVIGLRDKDKWNGSVPSGDGQFLDYVTHPTLPAILELLFGEAGVKAPTAFPRNDLVAVFLTGVEGLNQDGSVAEVVRLNTSIPAVPASEQHHLGVIAGDNAGFPNGRRLGDDVVDVALRVVMGVLLPEEDAPNKSLPFTDGALVTAKMFGETFPYLNRPVKGSPNDPSITLLVESAADADGAFRPASASFDAETQELKTAPSGASNGFYRLKSDREGVSIRSLSVDETEVRLGISLD